MNTLFNVRALLVLGLAWPLAGFAEEKPKLDTPAQKAQPTAFAGDKPKPIAGWGVGDGKSYWVPALGILGFDLGLNLFNRTFLEEDEYGSDIGTIRRNLTEGWVYDTDSFEINQAGHPYQGAMYHGFARSAGLGYWTSLGYTIAGSTLWEIAGEATRPSINDQFTTGIGGTFLGESLFRMASLLLESEDGGRPGFWRELGAFAFLPSFGFNRYAYGDRFDGVFRSFNPPVYTRLQLGVNLNSTARSNAGGTTVPPSFQEGEAIADATVAYGLPGKPGYNYSRPFDYFHFQFTAASSNVIENVVVRGLLKGEGYEWGDDYRGAWGLYGTYDYIAPQIFRISNTGVALGTTGQWWLSRTVALQGSALGGAGYGSGGAAARVAGQRDYHSGLTPQGLLDLRVIFSDRASIDFIAREYYITDIFSEQNGGRENIVRGEAALTVRVYNLHGLVLKYTLSQRDAVDRGLPETHQTVGAVSVGYAYLGQTRFGAVDWRPKEDGGPL